jgi:hypothetical protein
MFSSLHKKLSFSALTVGVLLAMAPQSQAALLGTTPVPPGSSLLLTGGATGQPLGTLVGGPLTSLYSFNTTAGTTSGSLTTSVYRESGGTLDFYYQVANNASSATAIARQTDTSFTGYTTSLGYRTDAVSGFATGTVPPTTGDVSLTSSVVGFQFGPPDSAKILPGTTSTVLVISTNATNFTAGNASIIDGGTQTVAAFQPAAGGAIPEPGTMVLLGGGLLALASLRKFRRQ